MGLQFYLIAAVTDDDYSNDFIAYWFTCSLVTGNLLLAVFTTLYTPHNTPIKYKLFYLQLMEMRGYTLFKKIIYLISIKVHFLLHNTFKV